MDILKQEIERKKRQLEERKLLQPAKKYFKRSDLVKLEEQEYYEKYGKASENSGVVENSKSQLPKGDDVDDEIGEISLPKKEVIKRLRDRGEPIMLFGETEFDTFKRLRKCEILEPESVKGLRNDFQEAMEKVDQEMAAKLGKGDTKYDMNVIVHFLNLMLKLWGDELNNRIDSEKMATRGKMALATYKQTQVYLRPLINKLRNHTLPEDISDSLTSIVRCLLDRDYIHASDRYLEMAIGNAPWPIGVTMVGIHARTGREKIFSKNVAHVLNDETQRKYIQGLKRLMTKCQQFFPTDPSRCVEYTPRNQ
ncbi:unnamed protein product [Nesidiocoris tenuis]|uniref:Pre-mRNA-splicing factor 18 n=1 Tax=Nesidiocoris tenuis TaxID=355587 RepID=A0A6H5GWI8_9HEMI|nr:unnamed protein product [Nesidiocoris tenuis]CAB0008203.1 unnamed protein product [Nesidiocoris tenuis]